MRLAHLVPAVSFVLVVAAACRTGDPQPSDPASRPGTPSPKLGPKLYLADPESSAALKARAQQLVSLALGEGQAYQILTELCTTAPHRLAGSPGADRAVSVAKAYCSDAGREVGNLGIQAHGGIGFTWEHDLQLLY